MLQTFSILAVSNVDTSAVFGPGWLNESRVFDLCAPFVPINFCNRSGGGLREGLSGNEHGLDSVHLIRLQDVGVVSLKPRHPAPAKICLLLVNGGHTAISVHFLLALGKNVKESSPLARA